MGDHDLAARNREHFNKHATDHSGDWAPMIRAIISEIQARRTWISSALNNDTAPTVKLLDYACGAGTVSKALLPHVKEAIGLDVSDGMVAEFNKTASELGAGTKMHAYVYDLLAESNRGRVDAPIDLSSAADFDMVFISMALHHVSAPDRLFQHFAKLLKPGGVCVVLDMITAPQASDAEAGLNHESVKHTIGKHGFSDEDMRELYEGAGLGGYGGYEYVAFPEPFEATMHGRKMRIPAFIARGVKEQAAL